ncbi:peripherin-2 [Patella vulgata]|uniref:peripherin-2 n=1 Tax=Patella vulgata TaxID=6465 RepID=UPI00218016E3|nr:peripherin-2 [Patella vulgata]
MIGPSVALIAVGGYAKVEVESKIRLIESFNTAALPGTWYLNRAFDKGIYKAMRNYKTNKTLKIEIDTLQIDFRCCGNNKYTDWFKISWIREEYVNTDRKKTEIQVGGYRNDDVPFSCCDSASRRPCINHHVHDNDMHYSYDYRMKTTIYPQGCRESLVTFYGKQLMTYTGFALLGTAAFQLIVVIMTRFLQTSIAQALELGDPEAPTIGYFFKLTGQF